MVLKGGWREWFFRSKDGPSYKWYIDGEGLNFYVDPEDYKKIEFGEGTPLAQIQHIALSMLAEQGEATPLPDGFIVASSTAVNLDHETASILKLPPRYTGAMVVQFHGNTTQSDFRVQILCCAPNGRMTKIYKQTGPLLHFSSKLEYLLTGPQFLALDGLRQHEGSAGSEYENLRLVKTLQEAKILGCQIDLAHFKNFKLSLPENISITTMLDPHRNLILFPNFGQDASPDEVEKVLGQLKNPQAQSVRVGDEIILLDSDRMKAVHEVLTNRKVPRDKIKEFLKHPTAYLDGSFINLDLGFSFRVHGATRFVQAYFGETDESNINWFGEGTLPENVLPFSKVIDSVNNEDQFIELEQIVNDAAATGATEIVFYGNNYDVTDCELVDRILERLRRKFQNGNSTKPVDERPQDPGEDQPTAVVDIDLLDDEPIDMEAEPEAVNFDNILYPLEGLKWDHYIRKPYPHQQDGVRWIVGLATVKNGRGGGLLADDMGLGKTYMALSAIDQLYRMANSERKVRKPVLVVAPLSVLNNWKEEIGKTFSKSPFRDVVILQSDADLKRFRNGGVETKNQDLSDDASAEIRYSLKIGIGYLDDRLDRDQRLIITTYQTLRDYQFSLCMIDWSFVVFDEAQNIKNPNTLQARAAKGLKADFRLLMTGTPVENSLAEFWCIMDTACPAFLGKYQDFRKKYIAPINQAAGDEVDLIRKKVGIALRRRVGPYMLRREKEDQLDGLPNKSTYVGIQGSGWEYSKQLDRTMTGLQLETYNQAVRSYNGASKKTVLATLHLLRDYSLHPELRSADSFVVPENDQALLSSLLKSGKLQSILELLDAIKIRGEKCIIFVVNRRMQRYLSIALSRLYCLGQVGVVNGDTKTVSKSSAVETRLSIIQKFEERDGFNVIIMSPIAAGVGLTIIGANNVIHLERHWNPAKEAQATDRVYRIGQERDVNVYIPILRHPEFESFDVNLHGLLSKKSLLRDAIVVGGQVFPEPDGINSFPGSPDAPLSAKDLLGLSWEQFEAFCAEIFRRHFKAEDCWLTSNGPDFGADVVLANQDELILVQCKHTSKATYDGYRAIQEVYAAAPKYANCLNRPSKRLLFATSARVLSQRTRNMASESGVEVYGIKEIRELLLENSVCLNDVLSRLGKPRFNAEI